MKFKKIYFLKNYPILKRYYVKAFKLKYLNKKSFLSHIEKITFLLRT